jgi:hypothetical protein
LIDKHTGLGWIVADAEMMKKKQHTGLDGLFVVSINIIIPELVCL